MRATVARRRIATETGPPRLNFISEDRLRKLIALSIAKNSVASLDQDIADVLQLGVSERDEFPAIVVQNQGVVYTFARLPGDKAFLMGFNRKGEARVYLVERDGQLKGAVVKATSQPATIISMPNALIEAQSHATMWHNAAATLD
jgi:hypothetical protein